MRPADAHETAACWKVALESKKTPSLLALTRQGLPSITPDDVANHPAQKGAYALRKVENPELVLVATGSEVQVALAAADMMADTRVSVVSMPSWFLFAEQDRAYQDQVLPKGVPTVSIEAASTFGWDRYANAHVGIDRFGLSGPGEQVMKEFGITPEHVVEVAKGLLSRA
jgi:transketolase